MVSLFNALVTPFFNVQYSPIYFYKSAPGEEVQVVGWVKHRTFIQEAAVCFLCETTTLSQLLFN